jgi:hypothetical protein
MFLIAQNHPESLQFSVAMQFSRFILVTHQHSLRFSAVGGAEELFLARSIILTQVFKFALENLETFFGGGKRTRTADICLAKAALYQLSYTPSFWG